MKWWDWMPWSLFSEYWALSQLFHSPLSPSRDSFVPLCFLPEGWYHLHIWKKAKSLSRVQRFVIPWTVAHQALPSLGFSRQEHWSGLSFPSPVHDSEKSKWSRSRHCFICVPKCLTNLKYFLNFLVSCFNHGLFICSLIHKYLEIFQIYSAINFYF